MDSRNRPRIIALVATAAVAILLMLILVGGTLVPRQRGDRKWPPENFTEIMFVSDDPEEIFVRTRSEQGDNVSEIADTDDAGASDISSDDATQSSYRPENRGHDEGTATPPTSSELSSDVKVNKTDKPAGNTKPDPVDEAAAEAARQQKSAKNINDRLQNRFSGSSKGEGKTSETDGKNASNGPGGGVGHGMTLSVNTSFRTSKSGVLVFDVYVLPDGSVEKGSARLAKSGNSGTAATDEATIRAAREAAEKCRFARRTGETQKLPAKITYRISD